jgi:hypothetical protein
VPNWHARAPWRFHVGLGDDLLGYLLPAWGFSSEFGTYTTTCFNDGDNVDPAGHKHKLEDESVGPMGGNLVASHLAALLDATPDPSARIVQGRFLRRDGTPTRRPTDDIVGVALADGRVLATSDISGFGGRRADGRGVFMDYDGRSQAAPDITTRGFMSDGIRYYLNVYPALTVAPLGAATRANPADHPPANGALPATGGELDIAALGMVAFATALLVRRQGRRTAVGNQ